MHERVTIIRRKPMTSVTDMPIVCTISGWSLICRFRNGEVMTNCKVVEPKTCER